MKKMLLASVAVLAIAGSSVVYAQQRPWHGHHHRMSMEDRAAFLDARIAAVKAGLKLTPDQDKLWPPLEGAVRDFVKMRMDRANARMQARDDTQRDDRSRDRNPVERLRERADRMGDTAAGLKKIADAADPLYKTLDDGQKRRLAMLTHIEGGFGRDRGRGFEREMRGPREGDFGPGGADRGPPRDSPDRESGRL